jgi:hypothetical protein
MMEVTTICEFLLVLPSDSEIDFDSDAKAVGKAGRGETFLPAKTFLSDGV